MKIANQTFLRKILGTIVIISSFTSCVVSMVPAYNENLENQVINAQKMTSKFYSDMMNDSANNRIFDKYQQGYSSIAVEINSIKFQLDATKKAEDLDSSVTILKNKWQQYQNEHKSYNTLSDGMIKAYSQNIDGFWKPLLIEIKALKMVKK